MDNQRTLSRNIHFGLIDLKIKNQKIMIYSDQFRFYRVNSRKTSMRSKVKGVIFKWRMHAKIRLTNISDVGFRKFPTSTPQWEHDNMSTNPCRSQKEVQGSSWRICCFHRSFSGPNERSTPKDHWLLGGLRWWLRSTCCQWLVPAQCNSPCPWQSPISVPGRLLYRHCTPNSICHCLLQNKPNFIPTYAQI